MPKFSFMWQNIQAGTYRNRLATDGGAYDVSLVSFANRIRTNEIYPEMVGLNAEAMSSMKGNKFRGKRRPANNIMYDQFLDITFRNQWQDATRSTLESITALGDWTNDAGDPQNVGQIEWLGLIIKDDIDSEFQLPLFMSSRMMGRGVQLRMATTDVFPGAVVPTKPMTYCLPPPLIIFPYGNKELRFVIKGARYITVGEGTVTPVTAMVPWGGMSKTQEGYDDESVPPSELDAFFG
jgi:hypothetical protein